MNVTYCDITKKPIQNASNVYSWEMREFRYDMILDKDISPDGMRKLEDSVRKEMEKKRSFNFLEHKKILKEQLDKATR
ncbi:MAG: hypothetical protein JW881_12755 [Spirochaetales bacterium]|nr:hypothetical protein [Spirochaetales bacterium]